MDFFSWSRVLEILGFSVGLLYLWWEYHADRRLWIASIVMPTISMWIYFSKGLYADFAINIYYFLIAIYGFIVWSQGGDKQEKKVSMPITRIDRVHLIGVAVVFGVLWGAMYAGLRFLTDSTVPLADSFTTALSIVAMWMLARKYVEQWLAWIAVDAVSTGLYVYKGIYFYGVLYALYTIIAFIGYRKWLRLMAVESFDGQKEN